MTNAKTKSDKAKTAKGEKTTKGEGGEAGASHAKSYQSFFAHWREVAARDYGAAKLRVLRRDPRVLLANCTGAMRAMKDRGITDALIAEHLPKVDVKKLRAVVPIAKALVFASGRVPSREASDGEIEARISRVAPMRLHLLNNADLQVSRKKFPAARVQAIRAGSGPADVADDAVQLVALYEEFNVGAPYSAEEMSSLREDGEWLLDNLGTGAPGEALGKEKQAPEARDRDLLCALLDAYYLEVLRVAGYFSPENPAAIATKLCSQGATARAEQEGDDEEEGEGNGGGEGGGAAGGGQPAGGEKGAKGAEGKKK